MALSKILLQVLRALPWVPWVVEETSCANKNTASFMQETHGVNMASPTGFWGFKEETCGENYQKW
jgi:hypothetical protein